MGMGGGYYYTLAKAKTNRLKIGWGLWFFQLVEKLTKTNPWDIRKLDMLITPSKLWLFRRYLVSKEWMDNN